jgi:2-polyprenyl-3-methyl-5-hydroxy-6-metoxy-1,4-benzoquinol methylase
MAERKDPEQPPEALRGAPVTATAASKRLLLVVLGDASDALPVARWLDRLPPAARDAAAEIAVLLHVPHVDAAVPDVLAALATATPKLRIHPDVRHYGHGGRRKVAYEYALQNGFDHVAVVEPDHRFPPERVAELWAAAAGGHPLVVASRERRPARERAAARLLDAVLGLALGDYASPFRGLDCAVLRRVPFHLNRDGRGFDTELLIQFRALGVDPWEIRGEASGDAAFSYLESIGIALGYRFHQLHLLRRGQYFVDRGVGYTLKLHPASSHAQVLDCVRPDSLVLDLGCSQGLLAAPFRRKHVRVVGVDARDPATVSDLVAYYRRDLERPLDIPESRIFDYVVCSDVIEHVVNRAELLRGVRRYLKPDGRLLISTPNIAVWFYRLSLLLGRFEYGPRGVLDESHVHLFTRATFRREIENAAFRIVRERVTALPFEVVFESTGRNRIVHALTSAYHTLARWWPELFAYQFLLEAEVRTLLDASGSGADAGGAAARERSA